MFGSTTPNGFTDYPAEEHQEDYEPARQYLQQQAMDVKGLLGLYEYGSVAAPGISDIDLIAVIDEQATTSEMPDFLAGKDAPMHVARVLDSGTIKPVSDELFNQIQILGEIKTNSILDADDATKPAALEDADRFSVDVANVIDWLPERILTLRSFLDRPELSTRRVLGGLGSLRHSLTTVNRVLGSQPAEIKAFSNDYDQLRAAWFDNTEADNFDATINLIRSGITTGTLLISLVTERLLNLKIFAPNSSAEGATFWLNPTKAYTFSDSTGDSPISPNEKSQEITTSNGTQIMRLPTSWLAPFQTYASQPGPISSLISSNIQVPKGYSQYDSNERFEQLLNERINWCNNLSDFLERVGLSDFLYRFAHLKPRP